MAKDKKEIISSKIVIRVLIIPLAVCHNDLPLDSLMPSALWCTKLGFHQIKTSLSSLEVSVNRILSGKEKKRMNGQKIRHYLQIGEGN